MRSLLLAAALSVGLAAGASALTTRGTAIVTDAGEEVQLHGINIAGRSGN